MSLHLDTNLHFSTRSLYQALVATLGPQELNLLWEIMVPLKIRIFIWQWVHGSLPSSTEVHKRNGRVTGRALSVASRKTPSTSSSVAQPLFSCGVASVRRLGAIWCHDNLLDLFREALDSTSVMRPALWVSISALAWMLWTVCNKLVIEHVILIRTTNAIYNMCGFLQIWRPLSKRRHQDDISTIIAALRSIASSLTPPLPPPPLEPD